MYDCVLAGLKFLARMASDMKLDEAEDYEEKLRKAERAQKRAQVSVDLL